MDTDEVTDGKGHPETRRWLWQLEQDWVDPALVRSKEEAPSGYAAELLGAELVPGGPCRESGGEMGLGLLGGHGFQLLRSLLAGHRTWGRWHCCTLLLQV